MEEDLIRIYRHRGLICSTCKQPYRKPYIKNGVRLCLECWGGADVVRAKDLWYDSVTQEEMDEIRLIQEGERWAATAQPDAPPTPEYKNQQTLDLVIQGNWPAALAALATYPRYAQRGIPWTGASQRILVEACEHPDCPAEVVHAIMDAGMFFHIPRVCLNPCGVGAMTPVCVCAEKGSLTALKACVERGAHVDQYPVSLACCNGHADVLDYLLTLSYSYNNGHEIVKTTLKDQCSPSYMKYFAQENGHWDKIKPVIEKHFLK